ncbi:MAG: diguanylate cyclase, partial [Gammaproteobacteria bacterium]
MSDSHPQADNILLEKQVAPLFKATLSGGLANIFSACLILLFLQNSPQVDNAIILSISICVISIVRILVSNHYVKYAPRGLRLHIYLHVFLTCITGILWGAYAYMQLYYNDEALRSLVILVNFGLITASIATLSTLLLAYLAYIVPQTAAIFYVFYNLDTEHNLHMVIAFIIFTMIMVETSIRYNRKFRKELELRLKNKALINDLNQEIENRELAQVELEDNKRELERKVEERTKELVDINDNLERVIDKKEQAEHSLQYLAYHDELTGLPNRNTLVDRIGQSIKKASRDNDQLAILFLDLDRFKNVNDSLGHTIGDKLLQRVASRLYATLRNDDTISRNGGDEFVVVMEKLKDTNEAIHVAKKIIDCLTETFEIQSHKIHLGASVGISIYPTDGDSPLVLLRNADTAMYRAKKAGGNQLQFYDESMSRQLRNRLELEHELHDALSDGEFYIDYQP